MEPDRPKVLIVDDELEVLEVLAVTLARGGFAPIVAHGGQAAMKSLAEQAVPLLLLDVRMPDVDGMAVLRHVQDSKLPVAVVMMSAFSDIAAAIEALKLGAVDYVAKPFRTDEVVLKLQLALERVRLAEEREALRAENAKLRGERSGASGPLPGIIGKSPKLLEVLTMIRKVADYTSTVLLLGESGTGKELMAQALHCESIRRAGPFVPVNCGAIPEQLMESELFGHVRGAFTDAMRDKRGLVEEADGGTLFLDEIGELPLALQVKLLRFLQEGEIRRVGETRDVKVDVRVVAATSRDLVDMVKEGVFREDLYYRLNVLQTTIPPLRERKDDIPLLVEYFLAKNSHRLARTMTLAPETLRKLMDYHWPGNIRELENTIERAMVLSDTDRIEPDSLPERLISNAIPPELPFLGDDLSIRRATRAIERELIRRSLDKTAGNRTRAAELLEISPRALLYKIKDYGLA